jgi:hypothetical protein
MTRALLCSALLITISCGSSGSDGNSTSGGANSEAGTANHTGGSNSAAGSSGSANTTGGTGVVGTGGSVGSAGTSGGTTASGGAGGASGGAGGVGGTAPVADTSVTQFGGDIQRTSHWVSASLTKANVAATPSKLVMDTFTAPADATAPYIGKFPGEVAATPLFLAGKAGAVGEYIAVTTQNDVFAFNQATGAKNWNTNIGAYLVNAGQCGTPAHHGIVSTPVIDPTTRVIYVTGSMADGHAEIHALSADTGMEVTGWPVDVSKLNLKVGNTPFDPPVQSQRSALSLVNGVLYVAFGGYCGDQGDYHGYVVGVKTTDPTQTGAWGTMDQQDGIWAPGGMASDGTGVFAVTGNSGAMGDHTKTDSEEIIRITGLGTPNRDAKNMFFPSGEWQDPMNAHDLDFGSSSPTLVTVPNSTPSTIIVAPAKPGRVYFLDATNLGGSLGQFADMVVAGTTAQTVYTAPSAYQAASGVHVAITTGAGSVCPGGNNDDSVMAFTMQPGTPPMPKLSWCATIANDATIKRSPISTNSLGAADPIVWIVNGTKLNGFDGETGALIYGGGTGSCGGVHYFTEAIVANGHIVAAGDAAGQAHLCTWSVH